MFGLVYPDDADPKIFAKYFNQYKVPLFENLMTRAILAANG